MTDPESPVPAVTSPVPPLAPKRRRRKRKIAAWTFGVPLFLIVWLGVVIALLPSIITPEQVRDEAVSTLTELLGVSVDIGRLDYHPVTGIELFDVVLGPPEGFEKNIFTARRIAARYDLSGLTSRAVQINELAIDDPVIIYETKNGVTNLDAILKNLAAGASPADDTPPNDESATPAGGPLSPIDVDVKKLRVGELRFEMVGEGPNASVSGGWLEGRASIDQKTLFADLTFRIERKTDGPNIIATVPGPEPIRAEIDWSSNAHLTAGAASHDGLAIQDVTITFDADARTHVVMGDRTLPDQNLHVTTAAKLDAGEDTFVVTPFSVELDDTKIVAADVSVTGLVDTLVEAMGPVAGRATAASLGLTARKTGHVRARVTEFVVPIDDLAPMVAIFAPDVTASGRIVGRAEVAGSAGSLIAGQPKILSVRVDLENVAGSHRPSKAAAAGVNGELTIDRDSDGLGLCHVRARIGLAAIRQDVNRAGPTDVELHAAVAELNYPPAGALTATVSVVANSVRVPGIQVDRIDTTLFVAGDDVLHETRTGPPIDVRASLGVTEVRMKQPDGVMVVRGTHVGVGAQLDHLLTPSQAPITYDVRGRVPLVRLPDGTKVDRTTLRLAGTVEDPRHERPFDAVARLTVDVARAAAPQATVDDLHAVVDLRADAIAERRPKKFFGVPPPMLPRTVALDVRVDAPKITGDDPAIGRFEAALEVRTKATVDVIAGTAKLKELNVAWPGVFEMRSSGSASRIYDRRPYVHYKLTVPPVDLERAVARLPPGALRDASDLKAVGKVKLALQVDGRVPSDTTSFDLTNPPMKATFDIGLESVSVSSAKLAIAMTALNGAMTAHLGEGRADLQLLASLDEVRSGKAPLNDVVRGVKLSADAGLRDDRWAIQARGNAETVAIRSAMTEAPSGVVLTAADGIGGAEFVLDASHPTGGGVELTRLMVALPASGIHLDAKGRLAKQTYGVLRPRLEIDGRVRLESVRPFVPALAKASGEVGATFSVEAEENGAVKLSGALELDDVHYSTDSMHIRGASGRLPFQQTLLLPAPSLDTRIAGQRGALGDDLEARLAQLQARFQRARMVLDTVDILVEAPRSADHQALRPYRTKRGPHLEVASVETGLAKLEDVLVEASYGSGMFRLDRVEARLWEGDVSGDLAVQLMPDLDVLFRTRGTMTNLNLDQPYSVAKSVPPVTDPDDKEQYRASATFDLEFGLRDRTVNGNMDVFKISRPLVERLFGTLFPDGDNPAVGAVAMSELVGVRPSGAKVWISHNLLNAQFEFERLWVHLHYESWNPIDIIVGTFFFFVRPVLIPTFGGLYVIPSINDPIRRISLSNVIDPMLDEMGVDRALLVLRPFVVSGRATEQRPETVLMKPTAR